MMEAKVKPGAVAPAERAFHAQVREAMGAVMAARGLRLLSGGPEGIATVANARCWVKLQLHGDREVSCCLYDVVGGGIYDLRGYLRLVGYECLNQNLQNSPNYRTLVGIGAALGSAVLDGPLCGDFSWAADYWLLVEELRDLRREVVPVLRRGA